MPSSGYLYGALEVVGLPADLEQRKGVVAGYRLVNSLRYTPADCQGRDIKTGAAKVVGSGKAKALTLSVRNTGNTLDPVSGTLKLKSALGTKNGSVKADRGSCPARASGSRCCPATRSSPASTRPRSR